MVIQKNLKHLYKTLTVKRKNFQFFRSYFQKFYSEKAIESLRF